MTVDDLDAVMEVRFSTRENAITLKELEEDYGITRESMVKAMQSHVRGWLCELEGSVAGFAMGDVENGEVQVVAVHPDFEGRGIGAQVLGAVCDWLFSEGHAQLWLGANPDPEIRATGFYAKLGWIPTGVMKGYDEVLVLNAPTDQ